MTEAGLTGFRFNTIGVSDGISMGTDGMSYSLQSRDVIADSIETIMGGQVSPETHSKFVSTRNLECFTFAHDFITFIATVV